MLATTFLPYDLAEKKPLVETPDEAQLARAWSNGEGKESPEMGGITKFFIYIYIHIHIFVSTHMVVGRNCIPIVGYNWMVNTQRPDLQKIHPIGVSSLSVTNSISYFYGKKHVYIIMVITLLRVIPTMT